MAPEGAATLSTAFGGPVAGLKDPKPGGKSAATHADIPASPAVDTDIRYFDPRGDLHVRRNRLPHWEQDGATYFLTFRLADALPEVLLQPWREERDRWRSTHPRPWLADDERTYHQLFSARIDRWLDAGHGCCLLRTDRCAKVVGETLLRDDPNPCRFHALVVMPNHVHALFSLSAGPPLPRVVASWKGVTARRLNQECHRSGSLWQKDYFDRLIRDDDHFHRCVRYIRNNPVKAKLREGEYLLHESDYARTIP